jgi:hypothetical protein
MKLEEHVENLKSMMGFEKKNFFLRLFLCYLLIGSILLYLNGKMNKKEKKYVRIFELQLYPFECLNFNILTFDEYYNDMYLNKFVENVKRINRIYLQNCKPWTVAINTKMCLRYGMALWIFFGMFYAKQISMIIQNNNNNNNNKKT